MWRRRERQSRRDGGNIASPQDHGAIVVDRNGARRRPAGSRAERYRGTDSRAVCRRLDGHIRICMPPPRLSKRQQREQQNGGEKHVLIR